MAAAMGYMKVGSLGSVTLGRFEYVFVMLMFDEYFSPIKEQIDQQAEAFGEQLGDVGLFVQPFSSANPHVVLELLEKDWPEEMRERIQSQEEPIMLIIDVSFDEFDPQEHDWAIVWFDQWTDKPDTIYRVFRRLGKRAQAGEDVFAYVRKLSKQTRFKKWSRFFELKPNVSGVGINFNAILEDAGAI